MRGGRGRAREGACRIAELTVVHNPAAGHGRSGRAWPAVARALEERGLRFAVATTSGPGNAVELAERAASEGATTIVAAGGDGTVNEVVEGLMRRPAATRPRLGILPLGTGTDLGRTFGIPLEAEAAALLLGTGEVRRIDIGRVTCTLAGREVTRHFVNVADAGIGGDVADFVNRGFNVVNGAVTFSLAAVITLLRWRNPTLRLQLDGEAIERRAQQVVVANCEYYGGGMRIAPGAVADDGLLDVVVIGDVGFFETLPLMGQVRSGAHLAHRKIEHRRARRVVVTADRRVGVDADGERPGDLPAVFEVVPAAIDLLVPAVAATRASPAAPGKRPGSSGRR